jgi:hypothetical protein
LPVTNAVISGSRTSDRMRRYGAPVTADTRPGRSHSVRIVLRPTTMTMYAWRRPSSSSRSVPAAWPAIAKTPIGVNATTTLPARESRLLTRSSGPRMRAFSGSPSSAIPRSAEKTTTAGTTLLASDRNGLPGMYSSSQSMGASAAEATVA